MRTKLSLHQLLITIVCILAVTVSYVHAQPPALGSHAPVAYENMQIVSPDKQYVAYVTADDIGMTNSTIWVAKPDGSERTAVATAGDNFSVTSPVWSPDSQQIAYLRIVDMLQEEFEVVTAFELWIVNRDGSDNRMLTDSSFLNPALDFGGKTDIAWTSADEIEFSDQTASPVKRYGVNVNTGEIRLLRTTPIPLAAKCIPTKSVPLFKQCNYSGYLGWCSSTICSAGCAISATSMVLGYYGADVDPAKLNNWLKYNGGYANGCLIYWYKAAYYYSGVTYVGQVAWQDWGRLRQELDDGYPVIVQVASPKGMHFVVVTRYSGDTYYINDSGYNRTTLHEYGNQFSRLIIYHGPRTCQPVCPTISLGSLPAVPCLPRDGSGLYYNAQLTASGGQAPYKFQVTSGYLPSGLYLSQSGQLSGTLNFSSLGTYTFTVKATDAKSCGGSRTYTLKVEKCPCPPISINTIEQPACLPHDGTGIYYQQQLIAEGVTEPYAFTLTGGELPTGLTLSPDGKIAGRLDKTQEGSYSAEITVSDSCDCAATQVMPIDLYSCTLEFTNWQIDVNGDLYQDGGFLPEGLDDSEFDWHSGLGTLTFTFEPGAAGDYTINASFDYLFASLFPERFDLNERVVGTPADNQLLDIELDQYDLTVDLGWDFTLGSDNDYARITFVLGETIMKNGSVLPYAEFLFSDTTDFTGNCEGDLQFTSDIYVTPEPGTIMLLGLGLFGLLAYRRKCAKK